jgi:anti-repressor protein
MYELTRDGFTFLVNKMQGAEASLFTENFIGAFNAMEDELQGKRFEQFEIPQTLSEALMLAAKQAEQIELQAPKVQAFETYLDTDGTMTLTAAAKALGMTGHRLGRMLREDGVFFHKNYASMKANLPRAGYEEYFQVIRVKPETQNTTYPQTRVTPTGLEWLRVNYTTPHLKVV